MICKDRLPFKHFSLQVGGHLRIFKVLDHIFGVEVVQVRNLMYQSLLIRIFSVFEHLQSVCKPKLSVLLKFCFDSDA
jgi:hypothetical protein